MGRAKEWMLEQLERGYSEADGDICSECVSAPFLVGWISDNASATTCTFCGRREEEPIAAAFDEFVGVVVGGIGFDWNHPDSEGISYISREGGYQAAVSDLSDVLAGYDISDKDDVVDALIESIDDNGWVERDYYIGDKSRRLEWGWESFKQITKHQTRYLFLSAVEEDGGGSVPASQMLHAIGEVIAKDLCDFEFVKTIGSDSDLIRIRIGADAFGTAADIGSPPEELAIQSNRMSPAGVSMFYGAFDIATAIAETLDPAQHAGQTISIGTFRALRELRVVDLAGLPAIPSVFDLERQHLIHPLRFLHAFVVDLAKPIARDGREHFEYVPTQIVTEYFRRVFRGPGNVNPDGLIYRSARHPGGNAIVLFCRNSQCVDPGAQRDSWEEPLVCLHAVAHQSCPALPDLL